MKTKGSLIAFVGGRGSGKTTVANFLLEELEKKGKKCVRQHPGFKRRPILPAIVTATSLWRFFDFQMMRYLGFRGRRSKIIPSLYRIYLPLAFSSDLNQIESKGNDFLIYDSNVLRGIISAVSRGDMTSQELVSFYTQKIMSKVSGVTFVFVETDPEESVKRWIARDRVSLSEDEYAKAVTERIRISEDTKRVVSILADIDHVDVIKIDGSIDPRENAKYVANNISA